jgi:AraC-like DNA-binding protein
MGGHWNGEPGFADNERRDIAGVGMANVDAATPPAVPGAAQMSQFSTDAFREHERVAAWREVFGRTLLNIDIAPRSVETFRANATIIRSAGFRMMCTSASAVDCANSPSLITNDDVSFVWMQCRSRAHQIGRSEDLTPGDGVLMSHGDVGGVAFLDACRYVALAFPKSTLAPLVPDISELFARRVPLSNPAQRMLLRYLELGQEDQIAADQDLQAAFSDHVCDLLALALGATRDATELARSRGVRAARLRAMQDDVRKSCHLADLSVHAVAARHGVGARYVQRLFEESGSTFTQYLAEQRLAAAYKALCRRTSADLPISTIAFDCGFSDVSHFNRAFRQRFRCTPSEVRKTSRPGV